MAVIVVDDNEAKILGDGGLVMVVAAIMAEWFAKGGEDQSMGNDAGDDDDNDSEDDIDAVRDSSNNSRDAG